MTALFGKLAFFNKCLLLLYLISGNYSPISAEPKIRNSRNLRHQRSTDPNNEENKQTFVFRKKSQGVIQYPNNSEASYGNQAYVTWKIYSRRNEKITIRFDYLDLERNVNSAESCNFDYVKLTHLKGNKEKKICRSHQVDDKYFESDLNYMEIVFKSDDSIPGTGFSLIFYLINRDTGLPAYYEDNQNTENKSKSFGSTKLITTMSLPTKTNTHTADTISSITETLKKTTTSKPIVTRIISNVSKTKQAIVTTTMKKELNSMKKKSPVVSSDEKLKFLIANKSEQNTYEQILIL